MEGPGFVHGGTMPVHRRFLVPAVAPRLSGALRYADGMGGLGEVHALLIQQAYVLRPPCRAHFVPRRVIDTVERPAALPAASLVSMALAHLVLPVLGQVLQRSLELAPLLYEKRGSR